MEKHPRYTEIADEIHSPLFYSVEKRIISLSCTKDTNSNDQLMNLRKEVLHRDSSTTSKKQCLFDSLEEEYLYEILKHISHFYVQPHQHLRDIFESSDVVLSKKLSMMHCDFIIRNEKMEPIFGIEIDGSQHLSDPKQVRNDLIKNTLFSEHHLPLLRVTAEDVRTKTQDVFKKIIVCASQKDDSKLYMLEEKNFISYSDYCTRKSSKNTN